MAASQNPPKANSKRLAFRAGRPKSNHKRRKLSTTVPEEAMATIEAMRKRLKMSMAEMLNSLLAYACWCEKEHKLTGDPVRAGGERERGMWAEIVREFGKPNKTGALFDHVIARALQEQLGALVAKLDVSPRPEAD